ncbi:Protein of unknown function [Pyronema omphalodes CBS 100304]|uniref:Uncharacterized protein n=1 Tax=Pyronema omphalodes (strain CBS 100304) TaxID=1076935 RepID=U4L8Q3_PYROM|nr:Protein of unknown function [Pyronema omphalodes CBS 100304]
MSRVMSLGSFAMSNTSKFYSPFTYQYDTMRIFEDKPMDVFGIVVPCYPPKEEITEGHGTYVRDKENNCLTDFSTTPLEDKVLSTMLTKLDKLQRFQQHDGLNEYLRLRLCVSTLYARIDVKTAPSYHQEILLLATDFLQSIVEENDIIHIRGQSGTGKIPFCPTISQSVQRNEHRQRILSFRLRV